ncbi:MAG: DNA-formamidopyrimidine glycosylase, partial [Candidatus Woesebacteria bacterium]|nr:DNA-formamidopyrimidine glycosylase [Candidatus Woesebacteria bacterium]
MPELPEVETIRLQLQKFLVGRKITGIEIRKPKSFVGEVKKILETRVLDVRRFGKVTVIDLDNGNSLLIHLKLTGQLLISGVVGPYTRVVINLDKGKLIFNDQRIFGWIRVVDSGQVTADRLISKLGPEPFKDLTLEKFTKVVKATSRAIKIVLMDQEKISGVGNIYANDALWLAQINPKRFAKNLSSGETETLYEALLKVLKDGLKFGGASDQHYLKPDGTLGEYKKHFLVYGRKGELCERPACRKRGAKIIRIVVG